MLSVSSKVLSLSAEAAVLVSGGKIVYANAHAEKMLGAPCVGKALSAVFSPEICQSQAGVFTADTVVAGKRCNVRTAKLEDLQAFFLSPVEIAPVLVNDAFLFSVRSALMNLRLSAGLSQNRAEESGDEELRSYLRSLQRDAFRITRLLDNASVVRGLAAGDLAVSMEPLDLAKLCREIADSVSLLRPDISFKLYGEEELCLFADRVLVEQMVYNLISNCLVHAKGLSRISISLVPTATQVILSVSDDGCGIAEDVMGHVFERYRTGFSLGEMGGGAGLGLSVVRGIARIHDGTLMLESRSGSGTSARVSLARKLPAAALHAPETAHGAEKALLTGLADCLPPECYDGKYLD